MMGGSRMERIAGPDDIELGDEAVAVEQPRRAGLVVSIRLSPEEADQLERLADQRRMAISALAKEIVAESLKAATAAAPVAPG
jgi:predicted DNA-binding ribbon-helix-helix protein